MKRTSISAVFMTVAAIWSAMSWGCNALYSANDGLDMSSSLDVTMSEDSVGFLEDAIILRDNCVATDSVAALDTYVAWDNGASDENVAGTDAAASDVAIQDTIVSGDDGQYGWDTRDDAGQAEDASFDSEVVEVAIRIPCENAETDCPAGFTCESTVKSGSFCRPPQDCTVDGLTDLESLLAALSLANDDTPVFVKIVAEVAMGPKTCSMEQCDPRECCRSCTASMVVAGIEIPVVLHGNADSPVVGCTGLASSDGSACDPMTCVPLTPGNSYVIWGTLRQFKPFDLMMDGFCDLSMAQPLVD